MDTTILNYYTNLNIYSDKKLFLGDLNKNFNYQFIEMRKLNDYNNLYSYSITSTMQDWTTQYYGITAFPYVVVPLSCSLDNILKGFSFFELSSTGGIKYLEDYYLLNNKDYKQNVNLFETSTSITSNITASFNSNLSFIDYLNGIAIFQYPMTAISNAIYSGLVKIRDNKWICSLDANKFNFTTNPSAYDSLTGTISAFVSPYISTIGIYDNDNNLLAIANFTKPIKKSNMVQMIFHIQIDM